jgi:uncharacterized protein (TIGR02246 family)
MDALLLVQRIAEAMMRQDDHAVGMFFALDAVMITPGGRYIGKQAIYEAGNAFNQAFTGIRISIKRVIACGDEGVVEWTFSETRRSDGWTHTMEDAIVFRLDAAGKVAYWREYFDPAQMAEI